MPSLLLWRLLTRFQYQNTIIINTKRNVLDAARRRWLHRHRHLFLPLLPSSTVLFDNIAKEVTDSKDQNPYIPLHELDEQPKLIENGKMKDYQVDIGPANKMVLF